MKANIEFRPEMIKDHFSGRPLFFLLSFYFGLSSCSFFIFSYLHLQLFVLYFSCVVVNKISEKRQEFLAKFLADLSKAIFVVGLASYFFKDSLPAMRIALGGLFIIFFIASFIIHPRK